MPDRVFRMAVVFSLLGHLMTFGLFSFSFGNRLLPAKYANVLSLGAIFSDYDLDWSKAPPKQQGPAVRSAWERKMTPSFNLSQQRLDLLQASQRPQMAIPLVREKLNFMPATETKTARPSLKRRHQLMLYPELPYSFLLYFKDRQVVFIELLFKSDAEGRGLPIVKRKISSGNIEADFLAMRYISHYLFMQQGYSPEKQWQTVKIELSASKTRK